MLMCPYTNSIGRIAREEPRTPQPSLVNPILTKVCNYRAAKTQRVLYLLQMIKSISKNVSSPNEEGKKQRVKPTATRVLNQTSHLFLLENAVGLIVQNPKHRPLLLYGLHGSNLLGAQLPTGVFLVRVYSKRSHC